MRGFIKFTLLLAVILGVIGFSLFASNSVTTDEEIAPQINQVANAVKEAITFNDKKNERMKNVGIMVDKLHEANEKHEADLATVKRAKKAYEDAVEIANQSAKDFNELQDSIEVTHPEAIMVFYSIDY